MSDPGAIRAVLEGISSAWQEGRLERLIDYLRPDVVYVAPGFAARLEGRDACIASYREFLSAAEVHAYEEGDSVVDVFGDTAVASYRYDIDYSLGADRYREGGRDVFVFARGMDGWRAVWRILVPDPVRP